MLDVYLAGEGKVHGFEEIVFRERYEPKNRIEEINWRRIDRTFKIEVQQNIRFFMGSNP